MGFPTTAELPDWGFQPPEATQSEGGGGGAGELEEEVSTKQTLGEREGLTSQLSRAFQLTRVNIY